MTDPTPLSPAAQAVLDAYSNASDGEYVEGVWVVYERTMLAAALRAAAEGVREAYVNDLDFHSADQWFDAIAAELAHPEPEGPTDEELYEAWYASNGPKCFARAVLARWGTPNSAEVRRSLGDAPQPIPVSERLPGPGDCDAEGRCWWWRPSHPESGYSEGWMLRPWAWGSGLYDFDDCLMHTHWLPAHALPVPADD